MKKNTAITIFLVTILFTLFGLIGVNRVYAIPSPEQMQQITNNIEVNVIPKHPSANRQVQVKVNSYTDDLSRAAIFFYVNGELAAKGMGKTKFNFKTGELGSATKIKVVAKTSSGKRIEAQTTVRPTEVNLVWEAETYTPPFYKGKPLQTPGSNITVTAFPNFIRTNGKKIDPASLYYTWEQNSNTLASGLGKRSLTFADSSKMSADQIQVTVESKDKTLEAIRFLTIPSSRPELLFYRKHPLRGVDYRQALLGNYKLELKEITLMTEPYFFSLKKRSEMNYNWTVNGKSQQGGEFPYTLTLRKVDKGGGSASVSLTARNMNKILQSARTNLNIEF